MKNTFLTLISCLLQLLLNGQTPAFEFEKKLSKYQPLSKHKIHPNIDCHSVDTCYISTGLHCIKFVKTENMVETRGILVDNVQYKLFSLKNYKEGLEVDNREFPDYLNSNYFIVNKYNVYVVESLLPSCTGVSCKYRIIQIIDIKNRRCYEKKLIWYRQK